MTTTPRPGTVSSVRRSRNDHASNDKRGPLELPDEETGRLRLHWHVREATVGGRDGYSGVFAIVRDEGEPSSYSSLPSVVERNQRYSVAIGPAARALGFEERSKAWFTTWHAATDAALAFAEECDSVRRARETHRTAEQRARAALFGSEPKAEKSTGDTARPEPVPSDV
jgi:hypothetical protein